MKTEKPGKRLLTVFVLLLLVAAMLVNLPGCSGLTIDIRALDLMKGVKAAKVQGKATDEQFINAAADFSVNLFKKTVDEKKNSLISPLSMLLALAMTANGADGNTLKQMEKVLGGDIPLNELNEYLYSYVKNLPSEDKSKLNIANSIWFRDDVNKDFLQKNADYYNAAAYKSEFDKQTIKDINNWVKSNTDGEIDQLIDDIDESAVMCLVNTIVFDARWTEPYFNEDLSNDDFITIDGKHQRVKFMTRMESNIINDGKAVGFIKPYYNEKYGFLALMPNENIPISEYIASLTGKTLLNIIKNAEGYNEVSIPKFKYDYAITMNDALIALGMKDAFSQDAADFGRMAPADGRFIGKVLQKTFIQVDENGTKAGGASMNEMLLAADDGEPIIFNRPFVFAIIDNTTKLPVFLGTVMSIR